MDNDIEKTIAEQIGKLPREVVTFISSANWDTDADEIGSLYNLSREELVAFKREVTLVLAGIVHPDEFKEALEQEVGIQGAVLDAIVANVETKIFAPIRPALIKFFEKEDVVSSPLLAQATEVPAETPLAKPAIKIASATIPVVENPVAPEELSPTSQMWAKISGAAPDFFQTEKIPVKKESLSNELPEFIKEWEKSPDVAPDNLPVADESADSRLGREIEYAPLLPPLSPKIRADEELVPAHPFEEKMKQVFTGGQQSMDDLTLEPAAPQAPAPQEPKSPPIYHADPYREAIE